MHAVRGGCSAQPYSMVHPQHLHKLGVAARGEGRVALQLRARRGEGQRVQVLRMGQEVPSVACSMQGSVRVKWDCENG